MAFSGTVERDGLLEAVGVSVRFGGVRALDGADLAVGPAAVTGLIGPNGAGKTTLFNVICGLQPPNSGQVRLCGRDLTGLRPHRRARLGIARTFQRLEIFGSLSVRENVLAAAEGRRRWGGGDTEPRADAEAVIRLVGLGQVAERRADTLPTGQARLLELGRALATRPRVLLLDEPSSGLDETESDELGSLLLCLADSGMGILLVEHDMDLVMAVCSRIFVLDFGSVLAAGTPDAIRQDPRVRAAYLGTEEPKDHPREDADAVA